MSKVIGNASHDVQVTLLQRCLVGLVTAFFALSIIPVASWADEAQPADSGAAVTTEAPAAADEKENSEAGTEVDTTAANPQEQNEAAEAEQSQAAEEESAFFPALIGIAAMVGLVLIICKRFIFIKK